MAGGWYGDNTNHKLKPQVKAVFIPQVSYWKRQVFPKKPQVFLEKRQVFPKKPQVSSLKHQVFTTKKP
ncbi:hypothetical protein DPV69_18485 [Pedobacter chitinilyticus]|uniref:Uncharacterized protein n=1 Tax=Pedobacter chitinilyticus TaxID=2233776 RepID=A0A3S3PAA5_9SPHI|nr:hypothetical protein DPV69_18485 [Pedobacter chitinilyticus]